MWYVVYDKKMNIVMAADKNFLKMKMLCLNLGDDWAICSLDFDPNTVSKDYIITFITNKYDGVAIN